MHVTEKERGIQPEERKVIMSCDDVGTGCQLL